jgi:hypothetical protein
MPDIDAACAIDQQITNAIAAHSEWKARLRNAVATGKSDFEVATVRRDDKCEFGSWLHQSIDSQQRRGPHYATVKDLHAKFHVEAARVLGLALAGHRSDAEAALEYGAAFAVLSGELTSELVRWRKEAA